MIDSPDVPTTFPPPPVVVPLQGGLQFRDAAPLLCGVVDNGVAADDPRVMIRTNEATKIILDTMIPVGGMVTCNITAIDGILILPPQMENVIEVQNPTTQAFNSKDVTQGWYEIVNNSTYLDPAHAMDNPLIDYGLNGDPSNPQDVRRVYFYPGLQPVDATVQVTGAKRYLPITNDEDFLIVQNIEALKLIILSIERNENAAPDEALKYRQQAFEMLQGEVKKHIMDPRNYMYRKAAYMKDLVVFGVNTLGWVRANIALDIDEALRTGKNDLTWSIQKIEERLMRRAVWKDCITQIQADVVGGIVYFPLYVEAVLAVSLNGSPIPIRSEFFQYLENGPGAFSCGEMLIDQGDEYFPATKTTRRKYKLTANCDETQCLNAVCKIRWLPKEPTDLMTIKNYEAIRLGMTAKFLEAKEDWQNAQMNWQSAFSLLEAELRDYLRGIRHTVHVQSYGFGLAGVGGCWGN